MTMALLILPTYILAADSRNKDMVIDTLNKIEMRSVYFRYKCRVYRRVVGDCQRWCFDES
jgi:hypothetical protein